MKRLLTLLCVCAVFVSYAQTPVFKEVKGLSNFTMQIPDYLSEATDLNGEAALQYSNPSEEIYIIVIDDSKEDLKSNNLDYTLRKYFDFAAKNLEGSISNYKLAKPSSKTINGNKALISTITGKFNEYEIFYRIATIESSKSFYQIVTWTMANRKKQYSSDMDKMITSLREL